MRRLALLPLLALSLSLPAAAGAQIVGHHDYGPVGTADPFLGNGRLPGPGIGQELDYIHRKIDRAREGGLITRREARQLRREANRIAVRASVYGSDGLSDSERRELESSAAALRGRLARPGG